MTGVEQYTRKIKKFGHVAKKQVIRVGKSPYIHNRKVWAIAGVIILATIFWVLPTFAAKAPGQLGYAIKRGEESLAENLAPFSSWRESLRLDFAANRITEAAYVANQADEQSNKDEIKTAATIKDLLGSYESTYEARFTALNQQFAQGKKPSSGDSKGAQISAVNAYTELQLLRIQAPEASQLAVLTAIDDTQQNIAALSDALGEVPLSASDFSQLTKLIPTGVVTKAEVDQLAGSKSSRNFTYSSRQ